MRRFLLLVGVLLLTVPLAWGQAGLISGPRTIAGGVNFCTGTTVRTPGTPDIYACILTPPLTALPTGTCLGFHADSANTGAASLTVNAQAAIPLVRWSVAGSLPLVDNDITANEFVTACYDGTSLQLQSVGTQNGLARLVGGGSQQMTGTRLTPRVQALTITDGAASVPGPETADMASNTDVLPGGGGIVTFSAPAGTPTNGETLTLQLRSQQTDQIPTSWDAIYSNAANIPLPTHTSGTAASPVWDYWKFLYNGTLSKWVLIAIATSTEAIDPGTLVIGELDGSPLGAYPGFTVPNGSMDTSGPTPHLTYLQPNPPAGQTLTNTRITRRVQTLTTIAGAPGELTPNCALWDEVAISGQANALSVLAPTCTPTEGQYLTLYIRSPIDETQTLTWATGASAFDFDTTEHEIPYPTATVLNAALGVQVRWNSVTERWALVARTVGVLPASQDGPYVLTQAAAGYTGATNLGALTSGVLMSTVNTGVATVEALATPAGSVVIGSPGGVVTALPGASGVLVNDGAGTVSWNTNYVQTTYTLTAGFGIQPLGDLSTPLTVEMETPASDDQVFVSDSGSVATWRTLPDCDDTTGNHLNYAHATNTFTCGTALGSTGSVQYKTASGVGGTTGLVIDGTGVIATKDACVEVNSPTTLWTTVPNDCLWVNTTGGNVTITIPPHASTTVSRKAVVRKISSDGFQLILAVTGGDNDLMNGSATNRTTTTQWTGYTVRETSVADNWQVEEVKTFVNLAADVGTSVLPVANGGTGTASTLTGLVRGSASAMSAAELSGAVSTSGSNATVLATKYLTQSKSIVLDAPVVGDTNKVQLYFATAVTLTRVACSISGTTSVTIQLDERAEATPNTAGTDVLTSALVCDADSASTTAFSNATIAARVPLNLQLTDAIGTPTSLRVHLEYVID